MCRNCCDFYVILKMNGGVAKEALTEENVEAVCAGFANLKRHVENIRKFSSCCN